MNQETREVTITVAEWRGAVPQPQALTLVRRDFFDVQELLEYIDQTPRKENAGKESQVVGGSFHGTKSWEEARQLIVTGDPAVEEGIKTLRGTLSKRIASLEYKPVPQFGYAGEYVDVDRYLTGDPECFVDFPQSLARGRRVARLGVNTGQSCMITPGQVRRRGAALLTLVDLLENNNIRVEIDAIWNIATTDYGPLKWWRVVTTVKRADKAVDFSRLSFTLGNASWLRRFGFWAMECDADKDVVSSTRECYGWQKDIDDMTEYDVILGSGDSWGHFDSDIAAELWIKDTAKRLGLVERPE